jgi:hypothetical protein
MLLGISYENLDAIRLCDPDLAFAAPKKRSGPSGGGLH